MGKSTTTKLRTLVLATGFTLLHATTIAQTPPSGNLDDPDIDVPIDGGLLLLLAAGAFYGLQKTRPAPHAKKTGREQKVK